MTFRGIHKLRKQARGRGRYPIAYATTLAYVVNLLTEGGGVKNWQNISYEVYGCPLIVIPKVREFLSSSKKKVGRVCPSYTDCN